MMMKAVVLAAGKGTRMKSSKPKVLHEIFDKPLLAYVLDAVNKTNLVDFSYVIVGHQADLVTDFCSKNYPQNTKTKLQQPQLGTGHAISFVLEELKDYKGNLLILCGDTPVITPETLKTFIEFHTKNHMDLTVMSAEFANPMGYGRIIKDNKGLKAIVEEKDATSEQKSIREINAGIYCLNWEKINSAFSELTSNNAQNEYYLTDIVSWAVHKKLKTDTFVIENNDEIFGINSKYQLSLAYKMINERTLKKLMDNGVEIVDINTTWISPDTEIEADTIIYPDVYVSGKNKIGSYCQIGPYTHLRGNVTIENNVKVGNFVEVKNSIIKSNSKLSHLNYIGDTDIGTDVNIGAGTITANYNPITKVKSRTKIDDGANTGSNSVIVAPVKMKKGSMLAAGSVLTKDINENALALTRSPLKILENWTIKRKEKEN